MMVVAGIRDKGLEADVPTLGVVTVLVINKDVPLLGSP
jgi:hypothetical protein